jgi:hypothetical protein
MQQSLFIRYVGAGSDDSQVPLSDLGVSLLGVERAYKDLSYAIGIKAELELSAKGTSNGSLVVQALVTLPDTLPYLFNSNQELLDFLRIEGAAAYEQGCRILNEIKDGATVIEEYYAQRPISLLIVVGCLNKLWGLMLKLGKEMKNKGEDEAIRILADEAPENVLRRLAVAIKRHRLRDVVRPIANESVKEISFDTDKDFKNSAKINEANFEALLSEDDTILPDFQDGKICVIRGKITSIKGTRGDSLTFNYETLDGTSYNLDLFPEDNHTTKAYISFYKEEIKISAEVVRSSMYKKPKLKLVDISKIQAELSLGGKDDTTSA